MKKMKLPQSPNLVSNHKKYGELTNSCIVCGKPTKENKFVHLLTSGELADTHEDIEDSQGLFPIGPDCAKLIPKEFLF